MNAALMIIDMQKAFAEGDCKISMEQAVPTINQAIKIFRKLGLPIIWVQDINETEGALPGTDAFELIDALDKSDADITLHKHTMNAFVDTPCTHLLNERNIDTVIISGFCADYCVISTYHGARDNNFSPVILRGGSAAGSQEDIDKVEAACDTILVSRLKKSFI